MMLKGELLELNTDGTIHLSSRSGINSTLTSNTFLSLSMLAGFTLIELLIAIAVAGIIFGIAMPSLNTFITNVRLNANRDSFVNALNYARSTALTQSVKVQVCPIGAVNSTTCGTNWSKGWIVATQPITGAPVLLKSLQISTNSVGATASSIIFDTHGLASTANNFTICDTRGATYALSVQVLATGYIQLGQTPGTAVWNNGALACP